MGRYLYTQIPRRLDGLAMNRGEIESELATLVSRLATQTGLSVEALEKMLTVKRKPSRTMLGALGQMIANDFRRRRAPARVVKAWRAQGETRPDLDWRALRRVGAMVRQELALAQRMSMLESTQRLFRFWHVAHRPLSVTALVSVLLHVGVVVGLGTTWFL